MAAARRRIQVEMKADSDQRKRGEKFLYISRPSEENLLEMNFVISFPAGDASFGSYAGGHYWGTLLFPDSYPLRPPAVRIMTPSGRFAPGERLCFSFSDFHPESWTPVWNHGTIITGLISFFLDEAPTAGSIAASPHTRKQLAAKSLEFNCGVPRFAALFRACLRRARMGGRAHFFFPHPPPPYPRC